MKEERKEERKKRKKDSKKVTAITSSNGDQGLESKDLKSGEI